MPSEVRLSGELGVSPRHRARGLSVARGRRCPGDHRRPLPAGRPAQQPIVHPVPAARALHRAGLAGTGLRRPQLDRGPRRRAGGGGVYEEDVAALIREVSMMRADRRSERIRPRRPPLSRNHRARDRQSDVGLARQCTPRHLLDLTIRAGFDSRHSRAEMDRVVEIHAGLADAIAPAAASRHGA